MMMMMTTEADFKGHIRLFEAVSVTDIKGLRGFLCEQVEDLLRVWNSVGNSKVFVPAAQLSTDVVQRDSFVAVTLWKNFYFYFNSTRTQLIFSNEPSFSSCSTCIVRVHARTHRHTRTHRPVSPALQQRRLGRDLSGALDSPGSPPALRPGWRPLPTHRTPGRPRPSCEPTRTSRGGHGIRPEPRCRNRC